MSKINWEQLSMNMIVASGEAKSFAMEGLYVAKENKFEEASKKLKLANDKIGEASHMHFEVIQKEAKGEQLDFKVLFLHAEDQLLTTQTLILLVEEMIEIYRRINK